MRTVWGLWGVGQGPAAIPLLPRPTVRSTEGPGWSGCSWANRTPSFHSLLPLPLPLFSPFAARSYSYEERASFVPEHTHQIWKTLAEVGSGDAREQNGPPLSGGHRSHDLIAAALPTPSPFPNFIRLNCGTGPNRRLYKAPTSLYLQHPPSCVSVLLYGTSCSCPFTADTPASASGRGGAARMKSDNCNWQESRGNAPFNQHSCWIKLHTLCVCLSPSLGISEGWRGAEVGSRD